MDTKVIVEQGEQLENLVLESWYLGQRYAIRNKNGFLAAIVPMEDLAVLEEIDGFTSENIPQLEL